MRSNLGTNDRQVVRAASTLKEQVVAGLREAIADLTFKPGDRLVERELCEMLGVSRTLVREGLSQLVAEGLVQIIPYKGPIVTVLDEKQVEGVFEVRAQLESLAARRFAAHSTPEQRVALRKALLDMKPPRGAPDPTLHFIQGGERFYAVLLEGSDNPVLTEVLRLLRIRITLLRSRNLSVPGRLARSYGEMESIVAAIERGHAAAAAKAAEHHVIEAQKLALKLVRDDRHGAVASLGARTSAP